MNNISINLQYEWEPFLVDNSQLNSDQLLNGQVRLEQVLCSHRGTAIYKWHGRLDNGEHAGKNGILIGETNDLRARLNQYKTGTQSSGNKYWREIFLSKGRIHYWILRLHNVSIDGRLVANFDLSSKNNRLIVEQLLVQEQLLQADSSITWVVNRMQ